MASDFIRIVGARQHNLKNLTLEIPREKLVVITGLSGSGKSSLAFDTLYAEGQRRYVESLSAYARQFLDQMQKPDVDHIEGLSPAIAIEQRGSGGNPRSTIATTTEIYDYLRVLYAAIGVPHDPKSGRVIRRMTPQQIVDAILALPAESKIVLLAPIVSGEAGEFRDVLEKLRREGFVRVRLDGEIVELGGTAPVRLEKGKPHRIEAVVDRLVVRDGIRQRLSDSVATALKWGDGKLIVLRSVGQASRLSESDGRPACPPSDEAVSATTRQAGRLSHHDRRDACPTPCDEWTPINYSTHFADPDSGFTLPALTPKHFSFNSHHGACPACQGLGSEQYIDGDLLVPDVELSLADGAIAPWAKANPRMKGYYTGLLTSLCRAFKTKNDVPWRDLPEAFQQAVLNGTGAKEIEIAWGEGSKRESAKKPFEGVVAQMQHLYETTDSELSRQRLRAYMGRRTCSVCDGARLRPEILGVTLASAESEKSIRAFCQLSVLDARWFIEHLVLGEEQKIIATELVREVRARLSFMEEVGLGYLSLDRESGTLSGGEAQRIRLATQIGSGLAGCLYVLDEPSIGLHQRDNDRLITTLRRLRDLGNSVIVVEHDEDTIRAADHVLDLGPGAGHRGGHLIAQGTPAEVEKVEASLTGQYLAGTAKIPVPRKRVAPKTEAPRRGAPLGTGETPVPLRQAGSLSYAGWLTVVGAEENNLCNVTAHFPLGCLTCVTGVSGSGKSTLVDDILRRALFRHFYRSKDKPGHHKAIEGLDQIDKAIVIDQAPIGRTPRSNPVTYTGAFGGIRDLFSGLPASRVRGYASGRFSFNVKGGRCEACEGDGVKKIEMHFLADVYVECEICRGRRYNRETLEITYKGKNIADILDMTVDEAARFFRNIPGVHDKLVALEDVGLGYLHLGQNGTTLSGGEAQRIKLAAELSKKATGRTVYILDEPTTGLHFADIHKLLEVLMKLRDSGNTLIIIEHNLEVIKCADWLVDMGPEGGNAGGRIVAEGTPEDVARVDASHTGHYLRRML